MVDELVGKILGKYRIESLIGRGGMATVYSAIHQQLGSKVALKVLPAGFAGQAEMAERFLREARTAAQLNHPNIVRVYDVDQIDGVSFFVMDFVDGKSLKQVMKATGIIPESQLVEISKSVLSALHEAHSRGIVHRDIKPDNIMIDRKGNALVTDFGIAKTTIDSDLTRTGMFLGTVKYASPEQIKGEPVDSCSEMYSWGVVMYEMATGTSAFKSEEPTAILFNIINDTPTEPQIVNPSLSLPLAQLITKSISKERNERFGSANAFLAALDGLKIEKGSPNYSLIDDAGSSKIVADDLPTQVDISAKSEPSDEEATRMLDDESMSSMLSGDDATRLMGSNNKPVDVPEEDATRMLDEDSISRVLADDEATRLVSPDEQANLEKTGDDSDHTQLLTGDELLKNMQAGGDDETVVVPISKGEKKTVVKKKSSVSTTVIAIVGAIVLILCLGIAAFTFKDAIFKKQQDDSAVTDVKQPDDIAGKDSSKTEGSKTVSTDQSGSAGKDTALPEEKEKTVPRETITESDKPSSEKSDQEVVDGSAKPADSGDAVATAASDKDADVKLVPDLPEKKNKTTEEKESLSQTEAQVPDKKKVDEVSSMVPKEEPAEKLFALNISVNPVNAQLELNGSDIPKKAGGKYSLSVREGTVNILAKAKNYSSYTEQFVVLRDYQLQIDLEPIQYELTLSVTPADSIVAVDGETIDSLSNGQIRRRLPPGERVITVGASGYRTKNVAVFMDKNRKIAIDLEKINTIEIDKYALGDQVKKDEIDVWTDKKEYRVGDNLRIYFRAEKDCYVYLYHESADGNIQLIFPNEFNDNNYIIGGQTYTIPDPSYDFQFIVQPPLGTEKIKALVTSEKRVAQEWQKLGVRGLTIKARESEDSTTLRIIQ